MKQEVRNSLIHIQNNPTTGTPHNANMITVQVETAFAIDELTIEVRNLKDKIVELDSQNNKLEKAMLGLTIATVILSVIQVVGLFINRS